MFIILGICAITAFFTWALCRVSALAEQRAQELNRKDGEK